MNKLNNIKCYGCGSKFYGLEGKEDTCPNCLKKILKPSKISRVIGTGIDVMASPITTLFLLTVLFSVLACLIVWF